MNTKKLKALSIIAFATTLFSCQLHEKTQKMYEEKIDKELNQNYDEPPKDNIHFEKLESLLCEASENLENVKNKELVIVLGKTGSGKSTVINFLQGYDFECKNNEETGDTDLYKVPNEKLLVKSPKIQSGSNSCTLHPDIYPLDENTYICDTAGVEDSRGKTENIFAHLAIQMAIKASQHIKCVIAVVEESDLDVGRGDGLKNISQMLASLFINNEYEKSTFIVFNKGKRDEKQLLAKMKKMQEEQALAAEVKEKEEDFDSAERHRKIESALSIFVENGNIISFDPLKSGARTTLIKKLQECHIIPFNSLSCKTYVKNIEELKYIFCDIAASNKRLIEHIENVKNLFPDSSARLEEISKSKKNKEEEIKILDDYCTSDEKLGTYKDLLGKCSDLKYEKEKLLNTKNRFDEIKQNIEIKKGVIFHLEHDNTLIIISTETYDEEARYTRKNKKAEVVGAAYYYGNGIVNRYTFEVHTELPICKYENIDLSDNPQPYGQHQTYEEGYSEYGGYKSTYSGFYNISVLSNSASVKYRTPSHQYGIARCHAYTAKCYTAENRIKASELRTRLIELECFAKQVEKEYESQNEKVKSLRKSLDNDKELTKEEFVRLMQQGDNEIKDMNNKISVIKDSMKQQIVKVEDAESKILSIDLRKKIKTLSKIYEIMNLKISMFDEFINQYNQLERIINDTKLVISKI